MGLRRSPRPTSWRSRGGGSCCRMNGGRMPFWPAAGCSSSWTTTSAFGIGAEGGARVEGAVRKARLKRAPSPLDILGHARSEEHLRHDLAVPKIEVAARQEEGQRNHGREGPFHIANPIHHL